MYKEQELTKVRESSETSPPLVDFNDRLQNAVNIFDGLTMN